MSYRIASRYAKSLIDLAQEKGALEAVRNDMILMNESFKASHELRVFLKSPVIGPEKKLEVLNKLFLSKVNELTGKFIILMTHKGREQFLSEIAESFVIQYNVIKNITPVTITSAVKLDKATIDNLLSGLKKRENLIDVELTEKIDESLLGGFILLYGDKQIDSSVRSSLQRLHNLVADDSYVKKLK